MKEFTMLLGFGMGLVAGALLYKHSADVKKMVNKGEQAVKQEADKMEQKIKNIGK